MAFILFLLVFFLQFKTQICTEQIQTVPLIGYVGHILKHDLVMDMRSANCHPSSVKIVDLNGNDDIPEWLLIDEFMHLIGLPMKPESLKLVVMIIGKNIGYYVKLCHTYILYITIQEYNLNNLLLEFNSNISIHKQPHEDLQGCLNSSRVHVLTLTFNTAEKIAISDLILKTRNLSSVLNLESSLVQILHKDSPHVLYKQLESLSMHAASTIRDIKEKCIYICSWPLSCQSSTTEHRHLLYRRSVNQDIESSTKLTLSSWHLTSGHFNRKRREVVGVFFGSISALIGTPVESSSQDVFPTNSLDIVQTNSANNFPSSYFEGGSVENTKKIQESISPSVSIITSNDVVSVSIHSSSSFSNMYSTDFYKNNTTNYLQSTTHLIATPKPGFSSMTTSISNNISMSTATLEFYSNISSKTSMSNVVFSSNFVTKNFSSVATSVKVFPSYYPSNITSLAPTSTTTATLSLSYSSTSLASTNMVSSRRTESILPTSHFTSATKTSSLSMSLLTIAPSMQISSSYNQNTYDMSYGISKPTSIYTTMFPSMLKTISSNQSIRSSYFEFSTVMKYTSRDTSFIYRTSSVNESLRGTGYYISTSPITLTTVTGIISSFNYSIFRQSTEVTSIGLSTTLYSNLSSFNSVYYSIESSISATSFLSRSFIKSTQSILNSSSSTVNNLSTRNITNSASSSYSPATEMLPNTSAIELFTVPTSVNTLIQTSLSILPSITAAMYTTKPFSSEPSSTMNNKSNYLISEASLSDAVLISSTFWNSELTTISFFSVATDVNNQSFILSTVYGTNSSISTSIISTEHFNMKTKTISLIPSLSVEYSTFKERTKLTTDAFSSFLNSEYSLFTDSVSIPIDVSIYASFSSKSPSTIYKTNSYSTSSIASAPFSSMMSHFRSSPQVISSSYVTKPTTTSIFTSFIKESTSLVMVSSILVSNISRSSLINTEMTTVKTSSILQSPTVIPSGVQTSSVMFSQIGLSKMIPNVTQSFTVSAAVKPMSIFNTTQSSLILSIGDVPSTMYQNVTQLPTGIPSVTELSTTITSIAKSSSVHATLAGLTSTTPIILPSSTVTPSMPRSTSSSITRLPTTLSSISITPLSSYSSISSSLYSSSTVLITTNKPDSSPYVLQSIGNIFAQTGRVFSFQIPEQTFYDSEDGGTKNLSLQAYSNSGDLLVTNPWLTFYSKTQTFSGIPLVNDYVTQGNRGVTVRLQASDQSNNFASDLFNIIIMEPLRTLTFMIYLTLTLDYSKFLVNKSLRVEFIKRISRYYGSSQSSYLYLASIDNGSTIVSWSNTSLGVRTCDLETVNQIIDAVKLPHTNSPSYDFAQFLLPEFPLTGVSSVYLGPCITNTTAAPPRTIPIIQNNINHLYYAIPIGIITIILLIVLIVLLFLWKRRKKAVFFPDGRTYQKGRPVLLPDEIELKSLPDDVRVYEGMSKSYNNAFDPDEIDGVSSMSSGSYTSDEYMQQPTNLGPPPQYIMPPPYRSPFHRSNTEV